MNEEYMITNNKDSNSPKFISHNNFTHIDDVLDEIPNRTPENTILTYTEQLELCLKTGETNSCGE